MSIVHIAGFVITVNNRTIQRCALCGAKLLDSEGMHAPVGPNGEAPVFPIWAPNSLVEVEAGNPTRSSQITSEGNSLPDTSCLEFV